MKLIKINTIMKKIFFFIVTTTMTLFMAAQGAGGHIYQQDPFGHFQSHYWPDYIDGVNSLRPECFEYSSGGNNPTQPYEIRNSSISLNRDRRQINTSSNIYGLTTKHQDIKFVETDIVTQAFRRADFYYDSSSLCWWNTSIPNEKYNYLSGAIMNARTGPHPFWPGFTITLSTGQGLIKQFELDANLNADIYTRYLGSLSGEFEPNTTRYQDVIVKVIEVGNDIYACGYCTFDNSFTNARGIIYKIPKNYFNPPSINCAGTACSGVELFTYGVFVSDIMEINGNVYFVGLGKSGGMTGMIGNLTTNYVREDLNYECGNHNIHGKPFMASMNFNPTTNEIECLLIDHHASFSGIAIYDLSLSVVRGHHFDVERLNLDNKNPNYDRLYTNTSGIAPPAAFLYKDLEYDQDYNFIISAYAFMNGQPHKAHFALHRDSLYMSGAIYRPNIHIPILGPLLNIAVSNPGPMQENIAFDPSDNKGIGYLYNTEKYKWSFASGTQYATLTNRLNYKDKFYKLDTSCTTCPSMTVKIPIRDICIENKKEATLEPGDFDIETNPHVHNIDIEEDYPMHCGGETEDGISGCPYWNRAIEFSNASSNFNQTTIMCPGDQMRLGAIQKNFFGTSTLRWFRDGVQIDQDKLTIVISTPGVYHFEATRNQYNGTTCTFVSDPLTITQIAAEIVAMPSDELCQGQGATLSVSGSTPSKFAWPRYDFINGTWQQWNVDDNSSTISVGPHPREYYCHVEYPNGCKFTLTKNIYNKGIYIDQSISETGSAFETLTINACNWDLTPMNNVEINTDLVPNLIVNAAPNTGGWTTAGNTNQFIISTMPAATDMYTPACTTITMLVRVNKCATTLFIQSVYTGMTCPPIVSTQGYWPANNFTAQITNTNLTSCTGALLLNSAPSTGGYTYQWLRNNFPLAGATRASQTANNSGLYSVEVSRNGCMRSDEKPVTISTPMTITPSSTQPVCTRNNGSITVNVTGGTAPHQFSINGGTTFVNTNVFNGLLAANYPIMVRDANGCTSSLNFNLTARSNTLNYSATITPKICTSLGSIAIINPTTTGTCTAGSFTYLWSNGQTTATATNLSPGSYTVTVTDCDGCTRVQTYQVGNGTNTISTTATIVPRVCNTLGSIQLTNATTTGNCGSSPLTYLWSNGATTSTISNLAVGTYTVTITDCHGCTFTSNYQVGNTPSAVNFTANLIHNTCTSLGSIAIVNPTTTASCGATFSYLWSNGQTTATATNLAGGTYTVTVTDCNGCTKENSYTITNLISTAQAEVVQSLMNCTATPNIVRYTAYPSGGTPGYNYSWLRNGTTPVGTNSPIYETNDQTNLSVIVTDANGYCFKKTIDALVNNPTVYTVGSENSGLVSLILTTIPNPANNVRIRIKGNFNINMNATWNNCDVIFETPSSNLTNVNINSGIIFNAKNTHIHTCDAAMQKGMVVQGTGRVNFDNCLVQDMYCGFQVLANASMNLYNNTLLENNFIGMKLFNHTVMNYTLASTGFKIKGGPTKTVQTTPTNRYTTANLAFTSLEPGSGANGMVGSALTKSYAGIIADNTQQISLGGNLAPIEISNISNGILLRNSTAVLSNIVFNTISDVGNTFSCTNCKSKFAIYAISTGSTQRLDYIGTNNSMHINTADRGIYAENYSLYVSSINMENVLGRAIETKGLSSSWNHTLSVKNSNIKARKAIHANIMRQHLIENNILEDIGTTSTLEPLVELMGVLPVPVISGLSMPANANIVSNTFKINRSRYGLSMINFKANTNTTSPNLAIVNNTFTIFNTATDVNGTYAAAFFNNLRNVDISGNKFQRSTSASFALPSLHTSTSLASSAPTGAILTAVENGEFACNSFYTQSGACFLNSSGQTFNGLNISNNNFLAVNYGMLFQHYANTSLINTHSNKFYCGGNSHKIAHNIAGTSPGSRFAAQSNTQRLTCPPTSVPACTVPTPFPFVYWDITRANFTVPVTSSTTGDMACVINCVPAGPPAGEAPPQSAPPMHKIAAQQETETEEKVNCYIFPNPARDQFSIELQGLKQTADKLDVEMLDLQGRVVYQRSFDAPVDNRVEVHHSATSGTYIVRVSDGQGLVFVQRIAVQHQEGELK